jgi:hypothetical protein
MEQRGHGTGAAVNVTNRSTVAVHQLADPQQIVGARKRSARRTGARQQRDQYFHGPLVAATRLVVVSPRTCKEWAKQ